MTETPQHAQHPISEFRITPVDNGFLLVVTGFNFSRRVVIQCESDSPDEFESVLDAMRTCWQSMAQY